MKTQIILEVDHPKPLPAGFSDMAAGRIETMACVELVEVLSQTQVDGMDSTFGGLEPAMFECFRKCGGHI